ncbi:MAG TPA: glycosyltransferase [Streptosporangiaceae bacterium]|jgi:cellulose synthase/poly-beta-1,6-N-acetylglucosamine synthase-like glycosyltransferase
MRAGTTNPPDSHGITVVLPVYEPWAELIAAVEVNRPVAADTQDSTVTMVLPACREQVDLADTVLEAMLNELGASGGPHQIVVVNDDSTDTAGQEAEALLDYLQETVVHEKERRQLKLVPRIIVLIPAHDEGEQIRETIEALLDQSWQPDEIYVLTDNAPTDDAANIAAEYMECGRIFTSCTLGNKNRKAGNLNFALRAIMPKLDDDDYIFGFDADSLPQRDFIKNAILWMLKGYSAVGATFHGRKGGHLLGMLQRAEFARFAQHQNRRTKADVMSGTGWAMRVGVMRTIAKTRRTGDVYNIHSLAEDYELTLALKRAGFQILAPGECRVITDVMTSLKNWVSQRLRWQHGTLEELIKYGWGQETREMISRQILTYVGSIALPLTVTYLAWSFVLFGLRGLNPLNAPIYMACIIAITLEQAWQARKAGPWAVISTLLIVPEIFYSVIRQWVYMKALYRVIKRKRTAWGAGTEIQ